MPDERKRKTVAKVGVNVGGGLLEWLGFPLQLSIEHEEDLTERINRFWEMCIRRAPLTFEGIMDACAADPALRDMLLKALRGAAAETDGEYRDALARLAGAAFDEGTKIDEHVHLVGEITKLAPAHLRVLQGFFTPYRGSLRDSDDGQWEEVPIDEAQLLRSTSYPAKLGHLAMRVGLSSHLTEACVGVLVGAGLVEVYVEDALARVANASAPPAERKATQATLWMVSSYGHDVMRTLYPDKEVG